MSDENNTTKYIHVLSHFLIFTTCSKSQLPPGRAKFTCSYRVPVESTPAGRESSFGQMKTFKINQMTSDLEFHVYFIACVWLALVLYYSQYFSVKSTYKMYLDSRQETCLHHLRAHRVRNLKIIPPPPLSKLANESPIPTPVCCGNLVVERIVENWFGWIPVVFNEVLGDTVKGTGGGRSQAEPELAVCVVNMTKGFHVFYNRFLVPLLFFNGSNTAILLSANVVPVRINNRI